MRPERKARLIASMPAWIATMSLFLIWEISVHVFQIREFILPAPSAIWKACVAVWPNLLSHSLATLGTVMMGFLASVAISLPLAMLIASSPTISAAIYPLLVITQSIPKVALAPILIVALGANEMPRIIVTFLVAFFPLVVSSVAGLRAVPPELLELGRLYASKRLNPDLPLVTLFGNLDVTLFIVCLQSILLYVQREDSLKATVSV